MTDALQTTPPAIDDTLLDSLGQSLFTSWKVYVTDRRMVEERWLRNLRQVRKIDDPEIKAKLDTSRSRAYPGITQWIVRGTIARLMQMLFPQTEKNYGVKESPLPELSKDQLQEVLDTLVTSKGGDPAAVQLTTEEIEKAIVAYAKGKAERMEVKITDDLQEMDFVTLARKVVKSATTYNYGVLRGPLHYKVPSRTWEKNAYTGRYEAVDGEKLKPLFEFMPVWDHYPDMTAVSLDKQDGSYDRYVMTRAEVEALADRQDFLKGRVQRWLRDNTSGNYKAQWWESEIKGEPKSATAPVASRETRKYEVLSFWGAVTGHSLRAAGVEVTDEDVGKTFHGNVWTIDNTTIKVKLSQFGSTIKQHHYFVFEDDDLSILGNGQCDVVRDSQLSVTETARALLDNMSVIGPMAEVNVDLLTPGQDTQIRKHKTWFREGEGQAAQVPAVRDISVDSHVMELKQVLETFIGFAEREGGLPAPSVGDVSGGGSEALRTTKNASMFLGAAALPIRDTVRNYDTFTVSMISALIAWNKKYDPNPSRDGDHDVIPRGSTSLIAKEVLSNALNEFRASVMPDEAPHVNSRGLLIARCKANDLPVDSIILDEDAANANVKAQQDAMSSQQGAAVSLIHAQVQEALASAFKNAAMGRKADSSISTEVFEALIHALEAGASAQAAAGATVAGHVKAAAAMKSAERPTGGAK